MKVKECINRLFKSIPDTQSISIYESSEDSVRNIYYVSVSFNNVSDCSVSGTVKSVYSEDDVKYICEKVYREHMFEEDKARELLEYAHKISMSTGCIDGSSVKIIKKDDDYRMMVPEMEMRYYWVSRYFEKEDIEEEEENEEEEIEE